MKYAKMDSKMDLGILPMAPIIINTLSSDVGHTKFELGTKTGQY